MHHDEHHEESKKRKKPTVSPHRRIGETFYSPGASSHSSSACTRRSICKPKKKLEGLDPLNFWNSLDSWRVRFPKTQIASFRPPLGGFTDSPTYHVGLDLIWILFDAMENTSLQTHWFQTSQTEKINQSKTPLLKSPTMDNISMIYETKGNHPFWLKSGGLASSKCVESCVTKASGNSRGTSRSPCRAECVKLAASLFIEGSTTTIKSSIKNENKWREKYIWYMYILARTTAVKDNSWL